jgi:hypothetical protein
MDVVDLKVILAHRANLAPKANEELWANPARRDPPGPVDTVDLKAKKGSKDYRACLDISDPALLSPEVTMLDAPTWQPWSTYVWKKSPACAESTLE